MIKYSDNGHAFDRAEGCWLYNRDSKHLDLCSGTFNVLLGWGNKDVIRAVESTLSSGITIDTTHIYNNHAQIASEALLSVSSSMSAVHFKGCTGGSQAIEQAVKHARATRGLSGAVVSLTHSHHGQSIFASNISGLQLKRSFTPVIGLAHEFLDLSDFFYSGEPGDMGLALDINVLSKVFDRLEQIGKQHGGINSFIFEPILGCGGGLQLPEWIIKEIIFFLKRDFQTIIIVDEIQTFARLGDYYYSERLGADIICLAKGISGVGIPGAGAIITSPTIGGIDNTERSLTWGASPMACAAIATTIEVLKRESYVEKAIYKGNILKEGLVGLHEQFEMVSNVRGWGLMLGFDIKADKKEQFLKAAFKHGILIRDSYYGFGSFIKLRPPLCISLEEISFAIERLGQALDDIC